MSTAIYIVLGFCALVVAGLVRDFINRNRSVKPARKSTLIRHQLAGLVKLQPK